MREETQRKMNDNIENQETYLQFYGPVNSTKKDYREYRVRRNNIASDSISGCPSDDISIGVKSLTDKNNKVIDDLKKQIREIEKLNLQWNSLKKISDQDTKQLLVNILQGDEKNIKQFELDNFQNDDQWTRMKKADNGINLKLTLSSINVIDENGVNLGKYQPEVDSDMDLIPDLLPANYNGVTDVAVKSELPFYHPDKEPIEGDTLSEQTISMQNWSKTTSQTSTKSESLFNDSTQPCNEEETDTDHSTVETTAENEKDNVEHKSDEEQRIRRPPEETAILVPANMEYVSQPTVLQDAENQAACQEEAEKKQNKKKKVEEKLQNMIRVDSEIIDEFNNEAREKRRKIVVMQRIAELQSMIDAEHRSVMYDRFSLKELLAIHMDRSYYTNRPRIVPKIVKPVVEVPTESKDSSGGEEDDNHSVNSPSEKSYQTSTTSTSDLNHEQELQSFSPNICRPAPIGSKKKRVKKGKKNVKKQKNGPKVTMEEVEAIRKKKKEETDRAFEIQDTASRVRLAKVAATDKNKILRRVAETALLMEEEENTRMPSVIEKLDENLDIFVRTSDGDTKIRLRNIYFRDRLAEVKKIYLGRTLEVKEERLQALNDHIVRSHSLFTYFMFLTTMGEDAEDFYEFELITLDYFLKGSKDRRYPTMESSTLEWDFHYFIPDVNNFVPETDQFVNAAIYVRDKMLLFEQMAVDVGLTENELILREAFMGIALFLIEFRVITNVTAFMQTHKSRTSFPLMEEWFLISRKLTTHYPVTNVKRSS